MGVFCKWGRGDWTDVGELGGEWAGKGEGGLGLRGLDS